MTRRILATIPLALTAIVLGLAALAPHPASAATINLTAAIDRAQAFNTCAGPGPGTGVGIMTYDTGTKMLSWNITFSGTSTAPNLAHFHGPAAAGVEGGVQVTIGDLTSPSVGSAVLTMTQETQLLSNLWYINYHTTLCPGGEIRGQVIASVGGDTQLSGLSSTPLQQPDQSSGTNVGFLAGITALAIGMASLTGAGVWFARKRVRN